MADHDDWHLPDQPLIEGLKRRQRSGRLPWAIRVLLVVVLLAVGAAAWFWWRGRGDSGSTGYAAGPPDSAFRAASPVTRPPIPAVAALDLPPLEASDSLVRKLVGGLSARPRLAAWLTTRDLVRRFVATVVNLAAGASPSPHLGFLAPAKPFRVRKTGGRLVIDPASYRRYDELASVVASLDTDGTARLYRQLHPLFEKAYRELGVTDVSFDSTTAMAVANVLAVPVLETPVEVQQDGEVYRFTDPRLEALTPAAKHLLRFGPAGVRQIQEKVKEIAAAVGIAPPDVASPTR